MTLLEYRVFHTVIQQGTFARAAQALHLTPSAISHAVSSMEEACGFALFVRGRGGVRLTHMGETLYPLIRQVLSAEEAFNQAIDDVKGVQKGTVRIGAFNSVCVSWVPELVRAYRAEFPEVTLEVYQGSYSDVLQWIKTDVVDLGFLSQESAGDLSFKPLYRDRLMVLAPRGWPTKAPGVITPEELRGQSFVVQGDTVDADIQAFLSRHEISVRTTSRVTDDLSTFAMVEGGFGLCIMPNLVLEAYHGSAEILPIEPISYREFGVAVSHPQMLPPAVRQMLRVIEGFAAQKRLQAPAANAQLHAFLSE